MKKLLPKLLTSLVLASLLAFPAYSETASSKSTPGPSSSKKSAKKSSKKSSKPSKTKKSVKSSTKKAPAPAPAPSAESVIPPQPQQDPGGPALPQQVTAYKYAYELYAAQQFDKAKDIFKKLAMVTTHHGLHANSLYYYSQCAFRTEDYIGCVKALKILATKEPNCAAIRKGYVSRFCVFLINQAASLQTTWDYFRYQAKSDDTGNPVWMESIPPGPKIKRINFRLAFGLYRVLHAIQPNSSEDAAAKQKLENMLTAPLTVVWVDEKAATSIYGHPADFFSVFSTREKKHFSKVICERMFFDFETEYFYKFLDMHDDVRNLKPRFVAVNRKPSANDSSSAGVPPVPSSIEENPSVPPPPGTTTSSSPTSSSAIPVTTALSTEEDPTKVLTLGNLLHVAGYYPWLDSYSSTIETELSL